MTAARYKLIGELPVGDWEFCLVRVRGGTDAIVIIDKTGQNEPRMLIGAKLVRL